MKGFLHVLTAILVVSILLPIEIVDAQSTDKKAAPNLKKPLQTTPSVSKGWEAEWQKTLEAGRKEGKISKERLYGGTPLFTAAASMVLPIIS